MLREPSSFGESSQSSTRVFRLGSAAWVDMVYYAVIKNIHDNVPIGDSLRNLHILVAVPPASFLPSRYLNIFWSFLFDVSNSPSSLIMSIVSSPAFVHMHVYGC